jgi:hypothetical protein
MYLIKFIINSLQMKLDLSEKTFSELAEDEKVFCL